MVNEMLSYRSSAENIERVQVQERAGLQRDGPDNQSVARPRASLGEDGANCEPS